MSPARFVLLMLGGLAVVGLVSYWRAPPPPEYIELGARPPELDKPVVLKPAADRVPASQAVWVESGKTERLSSLAGRPVLLHYWATWCPPCIAEMPRMEVMAAKMKGTDLAIVPVSLDKGGAPTVVNFQQKIHVVSLPVILAVEGEPQPENIPYTLLIDRQGRVAWEGLGAHLWDSPEVEASLRALLAE